MLIYKWKMKDKEKELKYLIYLESEKIKQSRKNIKTYRDELDTLQNTKKKKRRR